MIRKYTGQISTLGSRKYAALCAATGVLPWTPAETVDYEALAQVTWSHADSCPESFIN